jgi:hypothetical protein
LLGCLEAFARAEEGGGRTYAFPVAGRRGEGPTLRAAGATGRLATVYLGAKLGDPRACGRLTAGRHRLLQALVRETTRAFRQGSHAPPGPEVFPGDRVRDFRGRDRTACPLLDAAGRHVGFNGNGARRGMGYRLATPGGWLARAGYGPGAAPAFLADLAALAGPLGLTAAGLHGAPGRWLGLDERRALAWSGAGPRLLEEARLRVCAGADYRARWDDYFGWAGRGAAATAAPVESAVVADLIGLRARRRLSLRRLAAELGEDPSLLSKVLRGKKPPPPALAAKVRALSR